MTSPSDIAGQLCSGWAMFMLAKEDDKFVELPWQFSDEAITSSGSEG